MIPVSCEVDDDDYCGSSQLQSTRITKLRAEVGIYIKSGNSNYSDLIKIKSTSVDSAAISIVPDEVEFVSLENSRKKSRSSFSSVAYACSPLRPKPTDQIIKMEIYSDQSVATQDSVYPLKSSLKELFFTFNHTSYFDSPQNNPISIDSLINYTNQNNLMFGESNYPLIIKAKPLIKSIRDQTLFFKLTLADGRELETSTNHFEIK